MSNMNILTGMSLTASSMPCFFLRWVTCWNGSMNPVSGSMATHSPSTMASSCLQRLRRNLATSGKLGVRSSSLLEYSFTESLEMWAWILIPSYLNSIAHLPSNLSTSSGMEGSLSASMTFTGLPTDTDTARMASMPPLAMVSATSPMSQVMLNALSMSGRSSLVAKASPRASRNVMSPAPTLILPVAILHM